MGSNLSFTTAKYILDGFDKYYLKYRDTYIQVKENFKSGDWQQIEKVAVTRISLYDNEIKLFCKNISEHIDTALFNEDLWAATKTYYLELLLHHHQPELAETFYNSVFCCLFDKRFYNNNYIFVKPGKSTTYIDLEAPEIASYYITDNLVEIATTILHTSELSEEFSNITLDATRLAEQFYAKIDSDLEHHFEIQMVRTPFFRRRAVYLIGKVITKDNHLHPIAIAINKSDTKGVFVDALIAEAQSVSAIFSFSRSYFFVNTEYPAAVVDFLKGILPNKSKASLYSAIGLHKQGKTLLYRTLSKYSRFTSEKLMSAPGIKGMVMTVFTFPMFPYVFKVINDSFPNPKNTTKEQVKANYLFIKNHGRVGRLADTWEFSNIAFPLDHIDPTLLAELQTKAPSTITIEDNLLIVKHLYLENKMIPLDIFLSNASIEEAYKVIIDYGRAIDELINSNIFPGDMLTKNFGVTKQKRVVFYDYDEISTMDVPNFRTIPEAKTEEQEMSAEPWYPIGEHDVFPEEFKFFMFNNAEYDSIFASYYSHLLDARYWQEVQRNIAAGNIKDYYPYDIKERMDVIYQTGNISDATEFHVKTKP